MFRFFFIIGFLSLRLVPSISQINPGDSINPYYIQNQSQLCNASDFVCMPIIASDILQHCIGLEMVLKYNNQKVRPTSFINMGNQLINPNFVTISKAIDETLGQISIIVFLNTNAPEGTGFNGKGNVLCVEFVKTVNFRAADTAIFSIQTVTESYNTRTVGKSVGSGQYVSYKDNLFNGNMVYWSDNAPIGFNETLPRQYLPTKVFGCNGDTSLYVYPDLAGKFIYNINNGLNFSIERDIAATTSVQSVINASDALLLSKILNDETTIATTIYQFLAMDVNMDGKVSAGDLSQINQRSLDRISEYKQAWNYNDYGVKVVNKPSRDWVFIDLNSVQNNSAFRKSSVYPGDDGIGFSKNRVPIAPACFAVPIDDYYGCYIINKEKYFGIMLGDINGNYKYIPVDGKLKSLPIEVE